MLTSLYNEINVSKSPVSIFFPMLSLRCRWRSLMMGLLGWSAMHQDMGFDVPDIAALFKVSRQAVYKNIDRIEAMETELQPLSDKSVQCLVVEIGEPDGEENVNEITVKGLRQKGVSKENRKEPIVQLGLFLDDRGIPVAIEAFPGNTLDHQTLRPAMNASLNGLDFERYILVADRGMCIGPNLCGIRQDGHG